MTVKSYWVPWYPKDALIAFAFLTADEIGVLMQIVNMIYARGEPISNDPKHIGKLCNIQKTKCARIIQNLIQKGEIYINDAGKISKNRCEEELEEIRKKRDKNSEDGQKGAQAKWEKYSNQSLNHGDTISHQMAKNNTNTNTNTNISHIENLNTNGQVAFREGGDESSVFKETYDIAFHLLPEDLEEARKHAPQWDIYALIKEYNRRINSGTHEPPIHPAKAFIGWVKRKTQGRPPP